MCFQPPVRSENCVPVPSQSCSKIYAKQVRLETSTVLANVSSASSAAKTRQLSAFYTKSYVVLIMASERLGGLVYEKVMSSSSCTKEKTRKFPAKPTMLLRTLPEMRVYKPRGGLLSFLFSTRTSKVGTSKDECLACIFGKTARGVTCCLLPLFSELESLALLADEDHF
jgi:hypothetical protein